MVDELEQFVIDSVLLTPLRKTWIITWQVGVYLGLLDPPLATIVDLNVLILILN